MAENRNLEPSRIRSSNDRDQEVEDAGLESTRDASDEAVHGEDLGDVDDHPVDPDSPESENDRDDSVTDD